MSSTGTDIRNLPAIGVVAETSCRYLSELSFPEQLQVGISVEKLGTKSIVYALAIFHEVDDGNWEPAATGRFVHVYVDADTRKPVEIPAAIRSAAGTLTEN